MAKKNIAYVIKQTADPDFMTVKDFKELLKGIPDDYTISITELQSGIISICNHIKKEVYIEEAKYASIDTIPDMIEAIHGWSDYSDELTESINNDIFAKENRKSTIEIEGVEEA